MDDKIALRFILALLAGILLVGLAPRADAAQTPGIVPGDYCDPDDNGSTWTKAQKLATRQRVWDACKAVGGSDLYCEFHDAAVRRESWGGVASTDHVSGTDADGDQEYGLGPMGISIKWHRDKWPGDDEAPAFCTPEASFIVAHAITRRAVVSLGARNAIEMQAVYGGGRGVVLCEEIGAPAWVFEAPVVGWLARAVGLEPARRECLIRPKPNHVRSVCNYMRGVTCRRPITAEDVGLDVPLSDRRRWALAQARRARPKR